MTYDQVIRAVDNGVPVYWMNEGYQVIKDRLGRYLVAYTSNEYVTPLLAGDCEDCYIHYRKSKFCVLLTDESRPMPIWSIVRDYGSILMIDNGTETIAVSKSEIWRLT